MFDWLCPPAILYIAFSLTQIIIDLYRGYYNTSILKFIIMIILTIALNMLCNAGLEVVSWIIVFIPFISLTIITSLLLFVLGLSPVKGLNYSVDYPKNDTVVVTADGINQPYEDGRSVSPGTYSGSNIIEGFGSGLSGAPIKNDISGMPGMPGMSQGMSGMPQGMPGMPQGMSGMSGMPRMSKMYEMSEMSKMFEEKPGGKPKGMSREMSEMYEKTEMSRMSGGRGRRRGRGKGRGTMAKNSMLTSIRLKNNMGQQNYMKNRARQALARRNRQNAVIRNDIQKKKVEQICDYHLNKPKNTIPDVNINIDSIILDTAKLPTVVTTNTKTKNKPKVNHKSKSKVIPLNPGFMNAHPTSNRVLTPAKGSLEQIVKAPMLARPNDSGYNSSIFGNSSSGIGGLEKVIGDEKLKGDTGPPGDGKETYAEHKSLMNAGNTIQEFNPTRDELSQKNTPFKWWDFPSLIATDDQQQGHDGGGYISGLTPSFIGPKGGYYINTSSSSVPAFPGQM